MDQDELNREFRAIVRDDLARITNELHDLATDVALLKQSQVTQNKSLEEIDKAVTKTNNLIERAKGARWSILAVAALLGGLAGFAKDVLELITWPHH